MEVPTASRNAPNRFPVQFYPRWDVRLPFSQKIFSENPKNSKKSLRSLSESKQEKKSRIKSDFSNLVKSASPGLRSHNAILGTAQHTRTLQFTPHPSPPPKLYTGYGTRHADTTVYPPPLPSSKTLHWVPYSLVYIGTSMYFGDGPWTIFVWCNLNSSLHLKMLPPNATAINDQVHPWWYNFSVARHFCACALTLEVHKLLFVSHENLSRSQYSADGGGA